MKNLAITVRTTVVAATFFVALVALGTEGLLGQSSQQLGRQTTEHFAKKVTRTLELDYLLSIPESYQRKGEPVPLVLFLHGAGERGSKVEKVATHGPPKLIANGEGIPAIVVSPQCPSGEWWTDHLDALSALLDQTIARYNVDESRVYLTGLSMGGYGSWALAAKEPKRFAAVVPICGGGGRILARNLRDLPIWAFHGDADRVVPVAESRDLVESIEGRGGKNVRLTLYPGVGHDSWTQTYANPEVWEWLFAQRR